MYILSILPNWIIHLTLLLGILGVIFGFVLSFIPFVGQYKFPIQVISLLVLSVGVYLEGALSNNDAWKYKTSEMQEKILTLEKKIAQSDTKIIEKVITKTQIIRENSTGLKNEINQNLGKDDDRFSPKGQCELPKEFFRVYNESLGLKIK